jgi:hypothetical protein
LFETVTEPCKAGPRRVQLVRPFALGLEGSSRFGENDRVRIVLLDLCQLDSHAINQHTDDLNSTFFWNAASPINFLVMLSLEPRGEHGIGRSGNRRNKPEW